MTEAMEQLRLQSVDWGIPLEGPQLTSLAAYADLLSNYRLANVIGTRERSRIILEHLTDALSCYQAKDLWLANNVVDVGTGGGLPGIPLAIARPELQVALIEATERKVRFLEHARSALNLQNLEVLHARAEDLGRTTCREAFDLATARALAHLPVVMEYCAPLVRTGGTILAMKGQLSEEELSQGIHASRELGAELHETREVKYHPELPHKERSLILFKKADVTPGKFPRRAGLPKKRPLGTRPPPTELRDKNR